MLQCSKCKSSAVMPKSGLCLSCSFINPILKVNQQYDHPDVVESDDPVLVEIDELESSENLTLNTIDAGWATEEASQNENIAPEFDGKEEQDSALQLNNSRVLEVHQQYDHPDVVEPDDPVLVEIDELESSENLTLNTADAGRAKEDAYQNENITPEFDDKEQETVSQLNDSSAVKVVVDTVQEPVELLAKGLVEDFSEQDKQNVNVTVERVAEEPVASVKWHQLAPTFQQVQSKAHLKSSYAKIISSCNQSLEKLKGGLVSKGAGVARSFMLSSAYKGEGVTVSALAMAVALSRFGNSRVLLVDANAMDPSLHELFSLADCPGLIEYIGESDVEIKTTHSVNSIYQEMQLKPSDKRYPWAKYAYYTEYHGLYVMPYAAQKAPSSLWDVVENDVFQFRLDQLKQAFDYIVFDAPAILSSSEPALLSQYVDGVVLVIEAEKTKWEVAELAVSAIRNSGGVFAGSILNKRKFYIPKFLYRWI